VTIQENVETGEQGLNSLDQITENSSVQIENLVVTLIVPEGLGPIKNTLETHRITEDTFVYL
jgi:hypothetical protein